MPTPPSQFLADLYSHLPLLVVHLTTDGLILHCNPETAKVTGYSEAELLGRNFWATLFPGRLFAQVPKFISPTSSAAETLFHDYPMTIRTRSGRERVIGFTRFIHTGSPADSSDSGLKTWVCLGVDLTDRLLDADTKDLPAALGEEGFIPFGGEPGAGPEGDLVQPLAISSPSPQPAANGMSEGAQEAVRQVHSFLTEIHLRMTALESAYVQGEMGALAHLAENLSAGAHACGLLEFSVRAEQLQHAATSAEVETVSGLVRDILALYQPERDR